MPLLLSLPWGQSKTTPTEQPPNVMPQMNADDFAVIFALIIPASSKEAVFTGG
jgi:hypothetical protein